MESRSFFARLINIDGSPPVLGDNPTDEEIQRFLGHALVEIEEAAYENLNRDSERLLQNQRRIRTGFEKRLKRRWGAALDLYDLFLLVAIQAGRDFNQESREQAIAEQDFVFEALVRLHARACLIGSEIRALMVTGHASGAVARWRTLHELSVVAYFIKQYGNDVAERYMLHEVIKTARISDEYEKIAAMQGYPPQDPVERQHVQDARAVLVRKYGPIYKKDYGWAAGALRGDVSFAAIQEAVGMDHWRRAFMSASDSVHAGFKGMTSDIGQMGRAEYPEFILAGPSNAGLLDPADSALLALQNCTVALLTHKTTPERMIALSILARVAEDALAAFVEAHQKLEEDESGFDTRADEKSDG